MADVITLPETEDVQSAPATAEAPVKKPRGKGGKFVKAEPVAGHPLATLAEAEAAIIADEPVEVETALTEPVVEPEVVVPEPEVVIPQPEVMAADPVPAPVSTPTAAVPAAPKKESIMATTIDNVTNTTAKAQAFFTDASERAKGAVAKSSKLFEEAGAFGKGNVEALVESSKIAAKGFETMGQDAAEFGRKQFEEATAAFKTLATVKSPTEFLKLQSDFVRSSFDALVAETSRSTETALKLAGEVAQPISNRFAVAAEKMKTAA